MICCGMKKYSYFCKTKLAGPTGGKNGFCPSGKPNNFFLQNLERKDYKYMNNDAIQKRFVYRNTSSLIIALVLVALIGGGYIYGSKGSVYCAIMGLLALYMLWDSYRKRNRLLAVTRQGLHLSNAYKVTSDETLESLDLSWDDIYTVSLTDLDKTTVLTVMTTAGQVYGMDVSYHIFFRRKGFKNAVELCSGKPFGEIINEASATASAAGGSGEYEVRCVDDKYGIVDSATERVLLPFQYDYIEDWGGGKKPELISVGKDEKYGFVDAKTWKMAIPCKYDDSYSFSEGVAAVCMEVGKWFFVDCEGRTVIEGPYEAASDFAEGLCAVELEGKWGYIDHGGRLAIQCGYDRALNFGDGLAPVAKEDLNGVPAYGYINKRGEMVVDYKYDFADTHREGLATIKVKNRWGYIDTEGRVVIEPKYKSAMDFENGTATVTTHGFLGTTLGEKTYRINRKGIKI